MMFLWTGSFRSGNGGEGIVVKPGAIFVADMVVGAKEDSANERETGETR